MRELNENNLNLTRKRGNIEPKSKYFIVTEGDVTEIKYFQGIKANTDYLNINYLIDIRLIKNEIDENRQSHPLLKLKNFKKSIKDNKITYDPKIDKVFFIIDRDPQNFKEEQLDEFFNKCENENYNICLSNPTFELFLLMHDDKIFTLDPKAMLENRKTRKGGKRFLEIKLSDFFNCTKSNLNFEKFKDKIQTAIKNEKFFCEDLKMLKNNLGSNVGLLLEELISKDENSK